MNGEINIHAKFILKPSFIESKQNMDIPAIVLAFIFGLLIGSFLNVVIYRLPVMLHQESRQAAQEYLGLPVETLPTFNLMTPPSRCGQCGARVKPWQNIPIIVFSAAIVGIVAALIKRVAKQQPMAFGPCLAVAGWVVFLFHDSVMRGMAWYLAKSGF